MDLSQIFNVRFLTRHNVCNVDDGDGGCRRGLIKEGQTEGTIRSS